jgi:hypothetical protein
VITLKAIESMVNYQPFKYFVLLCVTKPALSKKNCRVSNDRFILTPEQIECFHRNGCVTIPDVLREDEVDQLSDVFERFVSREIPVPGKDFCDMSKPFGIPYEEWSLVNCMLPTRYYPPMRGNIYERLTASMAKQLFPKSEMTKDYDQLLNKRPGKSDAAFAWHQGRFVKTSYGSFPLLLC